MVRSINGAVCDLHGPTENLARTMSSLVAFPDQISALPDADVLDINLLVNTDALRGQPHVATVASSVRYATSARLHQVLSFYRREFAEARAIAGLRGLAEASADDRGSTLAYILADGATRYRVSVVNFGGYRAVRAHVEQRGFDPRDVFERFAGWHNGTAPVTTESPTALEISTFASGRKPSTLVLYRTDYECTIPVLLRRVMVERRLRELGWTYTEPRQGILFLQGGTFDAETHLDGDARWSNVSFVGEFQLR